jgi:hypothetical protein
MVAAGDGAATVNACRGAAACAMDTGIGVASGDRADAETLPLQPPRRANPSKKRKNRFMFIRISHFSANITKSFP